jgi:tetratricopeptide (TPR) repeat protein
MLAASHVVPSARVAISMVHVPSGRVLFGEAFPVDLGHLPESHDNVVREITRQIVSEIEHSSLAALSRTGVATAYSLYLLGRERLEPFDLRRIRAARKAFSKALRLVPDFYPALHMYARTLNLEWFVLGREERGQLHEARTIAERLIGEHPLAPEGFWEMGLSEIYLGEVEAAVDHFEAAQSRAPHYADILIDLADSLVHLGEHHRARPHARHALSLNPLAPDDYLWKAAGCEFMLGEYQSAIDLLAGLRYQDPAFRLLAACHALLGNESAANSYRVRFMKDYPDFKVEDWGRVRPFRRAEDTERFVEGLRRAGFA